MTTSLPAFVERSVAPVDRLRRSLFRFALRSPNVSWFVVRRERRLAASALGHAAVAFVLATLFPVVLFVFGPLLFGVAHVAADVRYLVLRRRLGAGWRRIIAVACASLVTLRVLEEARMLRGTEWIEVSVVTLWAALGVASALLSVPAPSAAFDGARPRAWKRAAVALGAIAVTGVAALQFPSASRLAFMHVHNLVALLAWGFLFRSRFKPMFVPLVVIAGLAGLLYSGALYRLTLGSSGAIPLGIHVLRAADWVAPGFRADYAVGLTSGYVFLQSIHYGIWLYLIPQEELRAQGTNSFRTTARVLVSDFGVKALALVLLTSGAVWVGAFLQLERARALYVSLATFHGYLETVMLAYFWVAAAGSKARIEPGRHSP